MPKKTRAISIAVFAVLIILLLVGIILVPGHEKEPIREAMSDGVLHERSKISLFGLLDVNPGLISAFTVSGIIIVLAVIIRIFVIPRFTEIPGKLQLLLEQAVKLFSGLASSNSPHRNGFLGAYIFTAGVYVFISTLFELFGLQAVTTSDASVSLPAPLADINGAIAMGFMSYGMILVSGIIYGRAKGAVNALKDFSLPVSMSFRLFGAVRRVVILSDCAHHYVYNPSSLTSRITAEKAASSVVCIEKLRSSIAGMPHEEMFLKAVDYRYLFMLSAIAISGFFHPCNRIKYREKKKQFRAFVAQDAVKATLRSPSRKGLSFARRTVIFCMRHRWCFVLRILASIRYRGKKAA